MMLPEFTELHSISDLHLGGTPGFQIFASGAEAEQAIGVLRDLPVDRKVALVINGDLVDFLAEAPATYFDPEGAVAKLDRIANEPAFQPVWSALRSFVRTPNRNLIITLGNHDLELAMPWVREHLLSLLSSDPATPEAGPDAAARGRITLAFDGAGYLCTVGGAKVLCVHGNEVDTWNVTDFERLRRSGRDAVQRRVLEREKEPWIPNAGAQLVIEIMNSIKRSFPFIDLLKPEAEAAVPTLLALDPKAARRLAGIAGTVTRLGWDTIRRKTGFLGASGTQTTVTPVASAASPGSQLDRKVRQVFGAGGGDAAVDQYARDLLRLTEERNRNDESPLNLIGGDEQPEFLGLGGALWDFVRGKEPSEVLRSALDQLEKDRSFAPSEADATFTLLDALVGPEIDFLLSGHTHLERALPRKTGPGFYFNSGTWVRLMKLEQEVLNDQAKFDQIFKVLAAGTMEALDAEPGLVFRRNTMVSIWTEGSKVKGELRHVAVNKGQVEFQPVPDTQFVRN
jgi:UDP-2,3-diacylglucosamine pyrophosphatase LpxH